MKNLILIFTICLLNVGCANFGQKLKVFLGGQPGEPEPVSTLAKPSGPTYSSTDEYYQGPRRQYKKKTHSSLQQEAQLSPQAGSLWSMEGQGAYLFTQNIMRMVGDPIGIVIEGEPREQLETKVAVIEKLLKRLEERQLAKIRGPASAEAPQSGAEAGQENKPAPTDPNAAKAESNFKIKNVPTRIIERLVDGNYRVKGSQPVMIGTREYKVIVTGIVRAEDFNDQGLSATKLLDPKFDIVSSRREGAG